MLSFSFATALSKADKTSEIDDEELPGGGSEALCVTIDDILEGCCKDLVKWWFPWETKEEINECDERSKATTDSTTFGLKW